MASAIVDYPTRGQAPEIFDLRLKALDVTGIGRLQQFLSSQKTMYRLQEIGVQIPDMDEIMDGFEQYILKNFK